MPDNRNYECKNGHVFRRRNGSPFVLRCPVCNVPAPQQLPKKRVRREPIPFVGMRRKVEYPPPRKKK